MKKGAPDSDGAYKDFFCCTNTPQDQALRDKLEAQIMVLKRLNEITFETSYVFQNTPHLDIYSLGPCFTTC